jgi:hypothetical protein
MSYAKGISWIDDCRIPFVDDGDKEESYRKSLDTIREGFVKTTKPEYKPQGRFPANLLVSDDMLNDGTTSKTNNGKRHNKTTQMFYGKGEHYYTGDKGTNSRYYNIDKWFENLLESCG